MDEAMKQGEVCKCPHHKMMPLFVVVFGAVFLLGALGILGQGLVGVLWPIILIAAGLTKMMEGKCKCC